MSDMSQKSVLITGASRGIGAATARAFAEQGARVALVARSREAIADLAGEIGDNALAIPCDVSRYWELANAVDATVQAFGGLDILINNAGVIEPIAPIASSDPEAWAKVMDINVNGVYNGIRAALPVMLGRGAGTILTLSSGAAVHALEGWSQYCASKAAVAMLTRCVDTENRAGGIRAMGLSPGTVATDMQVQIRQSGINQVSRLSPTAHIPPEWVARALVWMASSDADDFIGKEVSLRDEKIRARIGITG